MFTYLGDIIFLPSYENFVTVRGTDALVLWAKTPREV